MVTPARRRDAGRVLVTPRSLTQTSPWDSVVLAPLLDRGLAVVPGPPGRQPTEAELRRLVRGCVGWIAGVERISARTLEAATSLRVISRNGTGTDAIDLAAAERSGIRVVTAPGANARGVAELAVLLMLASLRDLPRADRAMRSGDWTRRPGRELADRTVGLVGLGAVGRVVARLVSAFGARVLASDPYAGDGTTGVPLVGLDRLFAVSDVVSLHCPPPADGAAVVTRELLGTLPGGAVLVNTARSSLVDEAAVLDALASGRLAGYAVDSFDVEPPAPSPLLAHERTIATPHLGGYTDASARHAAERAVSNLLDSLDAIERPR